jgi:hypothetical protein
VPPTADFWKKGFSNGQKYAFYPVQFAMQRQQDDKRNPSDLKDRLFYGMVVGACFGMVIGALAQDPRVEVLSMLLSAGVVASLAALSDNFWESLRSAWALVRFSFWRW